METGPRCMGLSDPPHGGPACKYSNSMISDTFQILIFHLIKIFVLYIENPLIGAL